jgi:hypothetical protein
LCDRFFTACGSARIVATGNVRRAPLDPSLVLLLAPSLLDVRRLSDDEGEPPHADRRRDVPERERLLHQRRFVVQRLDARRCPGREVCSML